MNCNKKLARHVLHHFPELSVKMKKPDILLHVDIREEGAFLTAKVYEGAGGMPVGSNGHSISDVIRWY